MPTPKLLKLYPPKHQATGPRFFDKYEDSGVYHILVKARNEEEAKQFAASFPHDPYENLLGDYTIQHIKRNEYRVWMYFIKSLCASY